MSDDVIVRTANPKDSNNLKSLMEQLCEERKVPFNEKRFEWGIKRRMYDRLQKHGLLVAEDKNDKKILGMIFAELIIDPMGAAEGYIRQVITDKEARGRKIGTKLIEQSINYLKEMGAEVIRINATEKQMPYYGRFGFKTAYSVMEIRS
ncbi:MAG: GNAT family N-acetyltransferase [Candidatus Helarchaeota archaeon]